MRFIGITGGVGAGKSAILSYLDNKDGVRVMLADEIAHDLMEPGTECYLQLKKCFGDLDIYLENGQFDRIKLAKEIFGDDDRRVQLNNIVHPAVKNYVISEYNREKENQRLDYLFLEAALLIEEQYDEICDELWYIYTCEEIRRERLKESRGYSDEKIDSIFASQLTEAEYKKACKVVIDNNCSIDKTYIQIDKALGC